MFNIINIIHAVIILVSIINANKLTALIIEDSHLETLIPGEKNRLVLPLTEDFDHEILEYKYSLKERGYKIIYSEIEHYLDWDGEKYIPCRRLIVVVEWGG